jgi:O-antigen ligase
MGKINITQTVSFILFTLIYFTASIVLMGNQYRPLSTELIYLRYILIILGFAFLIFIYFIKKGLSIFQFPSFLSMYLFIIWIIFSLSIVISEVVHQTFPFQGLFFLLFVPFIYFTVMPFITKIGGSVYHISLFIASITYIIVSYITKPIDFLPYTGILANPNGFGQISAISFITGVFTLLTLSKKRILAKILVIAALILSLVSVILSSSRTSFLIVAIITMIISIHFLIVKRNIKPLLMIIMAGVIAWFSPLKEMILGGLVKKFSEFYLDGNLFNGRTSVWEGVLQEGALFGHGEDYFQHFIEGAHNSIVYILGVYGIVPAILLTAFLLFLIILAFSNAFRNSHLMGIYSFVIIITFTLFSMTESMFGLVGNGITIAFYHVCGLLIFDDGMNRDRKGSTDKKTLVNSM